MGAITNQQVFSNFDPQFAQAVHLGEERDWIDHYAVADHARLSAPENSRRDHVQDVFGATMEHGVARIVPALAADDDVGFCREHIDDFPLPFVAPLRAD